MGRDKMNHTGLSKKLVEAALPRLLQPELAAYLIIEGAGDGGDYSFEELGRVLKVPETAAIKYYQSAYLKVNRN